METVAQHLRPPRAGRGDSLVSVLVEHLRPTECGGHVAMVHSEDYLPVRIRDVSPDCVGTVVSVRVDDADHDALWGRATNPSPVAAP